MPTEPALHHPPVLPDDDSHTMRRALQEALGQIRHASVADAAPLMSQWLLTLHHALAHPALWELTRELLFLVLEKLNDAGRLSDFIEVLEKGIAASEDRGDPETTAKLKIQLGRERIHQGDNKAANQLLQEGSSYFEEAGIVVYPPALNGLSYLAQNLAKWQEADDFANQALALLPEEDIAERALSYRNLGITAYRQNKFEEALGYAETALELWRQGNNPRYIGFGLVNVAAVLRPMFRYEEAKANYLQAIAIFEEVRDPINRANAQYNLGIVYFKTEQWEEAINYYYAAEQVYSHNRFAPHLAGLYNSWGMAYAKLGKWKKAIRVYQQSIEIFLRLSNFQWRANARDNLGVALMHNGDTAQALATLQTALADLEHTEETPATSSLREEILCHIQDAQSGNPT